MMQKNYLCSEIFSKKTNIWKLKSVFRLTVTDKDQKGHRQS